MTSVAGVLAMATKARGDRRFLALLADCARPHVPDALAVRVRQRAEAVDDWSGLVTSAEQHGLGPLLHAHVRAGVLEPPEAARRQLWALYGRHRRENAIRLRALDEALAGFSDAGLRVVVLKGPVLADLVYRDPGLRPMSDLDLLVPAEDLVRAQRLLGAMGFRAPVPPSTHRLRRKHHLSPAVRIADGLPVVVEVHGDAFGSDRGATLPWEARGTPALTFSVGTRQAEALAGPQMLWHLCRHMTGLWHPLRLIWVADVVGFCEVFEAELDWPRLSREMPFIRSTLAMIDQLTPLPESLRGRAGIDRAASVRDVGIDYTGWPRTPPLDDGRARSRWRYLADTCRPPRWWLRLNYGGASASHAAVLWRHARALAGMAVRRAKDRVM